MSKGVPKILITLWMSTDGKETGATTTDDLTLESQYTPAIPLHWILAEVGRQPISAPDQRKGKRTEGTSDLKATASSYFVRSL